MKKIFLPLFALFSFFFISCQDSEFNLKANVQFSAKAVSEFVVNYEKSAKDSSYLEQEFFGIPYDEAKEILLGMGGVKCFVNVNLAIQINGFSLKKIYAKGGEKSLGYVIFENEIPDKAIAAYQEFKKSSENPVELNFSADKKRVDFCYLFLENSTFFNSEENDNKEIDISKVKESNNFKKKVKIKIRGGNIVITPAEKTDDFDFEVVISRIKN